MNHAESVIEILDNIEKRAAQAAQSKASITETLGERLKRTYGTDGRVRIKCALKIGKAIDLLQIKIGDIAEPARSLALNAGAHCPIETHNTRMAQAMPRSVAALIGTQCADRLLDRINEILAQCCIFDLGVLGTAYKEIPLPPPPTLAQAIDAIEATESEITTQAQALEVRLAQLQYLPHFNDSIMYVDSQSLATTTLHLVRDLAVVLQEHAASLAGLCRNMADTTEGLPEHQRYDSREWLMAYSRCAVYLLHAACTMLDEAGACLPMAFAAGSMIEDERRLTSLN